ncbi:MAG TPA: hypothetical protein V6D19_11195 [Stenomitos sp.]
MVLSLLGHRIAAKASGASGVQDVTRQLELLGNPTASQYSTKPYARNVWDMESHGTRIYLGSGNSSNKGPSRNAGPVHVYYYDTVKGQFVDQFVTTEEQIERYVKLGDRLYIPGHDPQKDSPTSIYSLNPTTDTWERIPIEGEHIFDLAEFNRQVLVGRGIRVTESQVLAAADANQFYQQAPQWIYRIVPTQGTETWRIYNLFNIGSALMAAGEPALLSGQAGLFTYNAASTQWLTVDPTTLFPGAPATIPAQSYTIRRDATLNGTLLYIGSAIHNDQQHIPFGLYRASSTAQSIPIALDPGFVPTDVMVKSGTAFVLAVHQEASGTFRNRVYQSTNLVDWSRLFEFTRPAFARSFETVNGDFYFGMGIDWKNEAQRRNYTFNGAVEEAGNIYRVKRTMPQAKPSPTFSPPPRFLLMPSASSRLS